VVDEHVGVDSPAQFIDSFVAKLYLPDGLLRPELFGWMP
jgi:hypothetical protein